MRGYSVFCVDLVYCLFSVRIFCDRSQLATNLSDSFGFCANHKSVQFSTRTSPLSHGPPKSSCFDSLRVVYNSTLLYTRAAHAMHLGCSCHWFCGRKRIFSRFLHLEIRLTLHDRVIYSPWGNGRSSNTSRLLLRLMSWPATRVFSIFRFDFCNSVGSSHDNFGYQLYRYDKRQSPWCLPFRLNVWPRTFFWQVLQLGRASLRTPFWCTHSLASLPRSPHPPSRCIVAIKYVSTAWSFGIIGIFNEHPREVRGQYCGFWSRWLHLG